MLPFLYAILLNFLTTPDTATKISSSSSEQSITDWLIKNDARLQSTVSIDPSNGLRGLKWSKQRHSKDEEEEPTLLANSAPSFTFPSIVNSRVACSIPRQCILLADNKYVPKGCEDGPIEALAGTLLHHSIENEKCDDYFFSPYIASLPPPKDPSLASIGGTWTDSQLDRLGWDRTKSRFQKMRSRRERFIKAAMDEVTDDSSSKGFDGGKSNVVDEDLVAWTYDIARSRALEGNFGLGGIVRLSILSTFLSLILAFLPLVTIDMTSATSIPLLNILPLLVSSTVLSGILIKAQQQPELAFIPWVDFANHKSDSSSEVRGTKEGLVFEYDNFQDAILLKKKEGSDSITSSSSFQGNNKEWITFNYGGQQEGITNDRLLGEYGFVEEDNANDRFVLEIGGSYLLSMGRHGRYTLKPSSNYGGGENDDEEGNEELPTETEIRALVITTRDELTSLIENENNPPKDPVDLERAKLASIWRREKVRLIDEYLSLK